MSGDGSCGNIRTIQGSEVYHRLPGFSCCRTVGFVVYYPRVSMERRVRRLESMSSYKAQVEKYGTPISDAQLRHFAPMQKVGISGYLASKILSETSKPSS